LRVRAPANLLQFSRLASGTSREEVGAPGEGKDGGTFVVKWLVGVPKDVLVSMGWFSIYIELEGSVRLAEDGEIKHVDLPILLALECPLDVGVDRVEEVEEGVNMVAVDGCHGVVHVTKPE
jgi:hypothetical protein